MTNSKPPASGPRSVSQPSKSSKATSRTLDDVGLGAEGTLPFDKLRAALLVYLLERPAVPVPIDEKEILEWRQDHGGPICKRPVTYFPTNDRGEDQARATIDWLTAHGVVKVSTAQDSQEDLTAAVCRSVATMGEGALRSFSEHMFEKCPWLEPPGAATSEVKPSQDDPLPDPIRNVDLAKLAGMDDPDYVSKVMRKALRAAGRPVRTGGTGIVRDWSRADLRAAAPHDRGQLGRYLRSIFPPVCKPE